MPKSELDTRKEKEKFISILKAKAGIVSSACDAYGLSSRSTFYEWKNTDPWFKDQVENIDEDVLDFTESRLHENIDRGDIVSIIFYLKCKGKKRGYSEKIEQTNTNINIDAGSSHAEIAEKLGADVANEIFAKLLK